MRPIALGSVLLMLAAIVGQSIVTAQTRSPAKPERAKPPVFTERTKNVFYDDAREALAGPRPQYTPDGAPGKTPSGVAPSSSDDEPPASGGIYAWSRIISSETIEDEIKSLNLLLDETVTIPQQYASGNYRAGQQYLSVLAVLFGIIGEYDGDVRWKNQAPQAREIFSAAGFGSRVGSIQAFNQAKGAKERLADLIRGSNIDGPPAEAKANWGEVAYRPPLMQRLEEAQHNRLQPWTSSEAEFKKSTDRILHEAQLIAALADVMSRDGFDYADDDEYVELCMSMKKAALDVVEAVKLNSADLARKAVGEISKSCNDCHEGFRGK